MIVSFRSPEIAVAVYRSISKALAEKHHFFIYSPFRWRGRELGEPVAMETLEVFQRRRSMSKGRKPLRGLRKLKYLTEMAGRYAGLRFKLQRLKPSAVFVWNAERGRGKALASAARDLDIPTLIFEHAPIPGRLTVDFAGVNAKASVPRDPEFFRTWANGRAAVDWRREGQRLVARKPRRQVRATPAAIPKNYVFLPLQVATDTQILINGRWVPSIADLLLAAIRQIPRLPEGWALVVKEHPSCKIKNSSILREFVQSRLVVAEAEDTFSLVRNSRGVLTLNSSVGLQSFFFDKPVCVLGEAFYRQPGLVEIADSEQELGDQFARAADWTFDAELRDAFMSWLCEEYYVPIDERNPTAISERALTMVKRKLEQAAA